MMIWGQQSRREVKVQLKAKVSLYIPKMKSFNIADLVCSLYFLVLSFCLFSPIFV